jgi:Anti-sigma-28 factor, FlgM
MTLRGAAIQGFAALFMIGSGHVFAQVQPPSVPERVAELKAALAASTYAPDITLVAKAKDLQVAVQNRVVTEG